MTTKIAAIVFLLLALSGVVLADPVRPMQPYPITSNESGFLDRQIQEIYQRILRYVDTLNQLRRDTANAALASASLYDDTASQGLWKATKARDTANIAYARINLYDDTASLGLWNTGNNITVRRVNTDTIRSHNGDGDLYLEVGTGIVVIRDLNDNGPGQLYFREKPSNGTSYIGLEAPASLSASKLFVLPGADGNSGQVVSTNGVGTLSFTTRATQAEINDSLLTVRNTANAAYSEAYLAMDTASIALRPRVQAGTAVLPASQTLDTVIIKNAAGIVQHYVNQYTYAVFITPIGYNNVADIWYGPTGNVYDSLTVCGNLTTGYLLTDSSFAVHKLWNGTYDLRIYWMVMRIL